MKSSSGDKPSGWSFLTNHARVLQAVAADPTIRLRDVASQVGITERRAAQIVGELERAGYLSKARDGRRNRYQIHEDLSLRHPSHQHRTLRELIHFLNDTGQRAGRGN
jgi:DNA-binding IclR family transcriptional regulator